MNQEQLRSSQAPLKERYRQNPAAAMITLSAAGSLGEGVACNVATSKAMIEAGLHPATGGSGMQACSGDMLLEALVACAGVTFSAVATALGLEIRSSTLRAEGDLDFRGTLGVDRDAPVGFQAIRLIGRRCNAGATNKTAGAYRTLLCRFADVAQRRETKRRVRKHCSINHRNG